MAEVINSRYESEIRVEKQYFTEYKWTLRNWSALYQSVYRSGISTEKFHLNGTNGCTCKISLKVLDDYPVSIRLSNTLDIFDATVTISVNGRVTCYTSTYQPSSNSYVFGYGTSKLLRKDTSDYIFRNKACVDETVIITLKIMIGNSTTITSPAKTVITRKKLSEKSDDSSPNILTNFKAMFEKKILCDVTFVLPDKTFSAHKTILAARSKVFEAMFVSSFQEQNKNSFDIKDVEAEVFEKFLNYLYGEDIDVDAMVEDMLAVADFYQVCDLKDVCESHMLADLSDENVVRYVILADKFSCTALKSEALDWLRDSQTILEKALVEESLETMTCLKKILSNERSED